MEEDESWKGEHLIRKKPKDNRKEAARMSNILFHKKRRMAGLPPAGGAKHNTFLKAMWAEKKQ